MENGRDDPELARALEAIAVVDDVRALIALLQERVLRDVQVVQGSGEHLYYSHRVLAGIDSYYFVNDTDESRSVRVRLAAAGAAELWDPDGGGRRPLPGREEFDLDFAPWQAYYVVIDSARDPHPAEAAKAPTLSPFPIEGPWTLSLEPGLVPVAYTDGEWLSRERFALRDWWVIGPFDYRLHLGWNESFPPELEFDPSATYDGKYGPVAWTRHTSESHVVDLQAAAGRPAETAFGGVRSATLYALTHVFSPEARRAQLRVVGDANAKAWVNEELVAAERDDHLGYLEMRDAYAQQVPVDLVAGWNRLLVKVSQAFRYGPGLRLFARICADDGTPLTELVGSADMVQPPPSREYTYRLDVPPGAVAAVLPGFTANCSASLDGRPLPVEEGRVPLPAPGRVLKIGMPPPADLLDMPQFEVGPAAWELGSWSATPIAFFAGTGVYEAEFDLPAAYTGVPLALDVGTVGVVAEAWLNGHALGERVWRPFSFDVTQAIVPGKNSLRVAVTNTNANRRARRHEEIKMGNVPMSGPGLLKAIVENGLLGPVRLVP